MLDRDIRSAILGLKKRGYGLRRIGRELGISRNSVRDILKSGSSEVPPIERKDLWLDHVDLIRGLYGTCEGNLVRVCEELEARGIAMAYSTLTRACRRWGISISKPTEPAGQYTFLPGQEMQHDTSPNKVKIDGKKRKIEVAGLWLGYSRMEYAQGYPTFNRFLCKAFLTEAFKYMDGACERCTIDNTSVIVASGTGADALIAPEMEVFAERFGFKFIPHEKGDVNRSAGKERFFGYIQKNFFVGRTFSSLEDFNHQLREWCDKVNRKYRRRLKAKPIELFALEHLHMKRLPAYIPEVYKLHHRIVDTSAFVHVHTNRYSVDPKWIGREVEVRETLEQIRICHRHQLIATHRRQEGQYLTLVLPEHEWSERNRRQKKSVEPSAEEKMLRLGPEELGAMVDAIKKNPSGQAFRSIRQLRRLYLEYPLEPLLKVLRIALHYGLTDVARIEKMVLREISGIFFRLPLTEENTDD